jgi:hypothetical protein
MSRVIYGDAVIDWVACRLPGPFTGELFGIGQISATGAITVGALFNARKAHDISVHLVAEAPLHRRFLYACAHYPFKVCGVERLTTRCRASNLAARRVIEGAGFKYEGCERRGWPDGEDKLLFGMLREEVVWLNSRFAPQRGPTRTAPIPAACSPQMEAA